MRLKLWPWTMRHGKATAGDRSGSFTTASSILNGKAVRVEALDEAALGEHHEAGVIRRHRNHVNDPLVLREQTIILYANGGRCMAIKCETAASLLRF